MSGENEIVFVNETSLDISPELQKGIIDALQGKILEEASDALTEDNPDTVIDLPCNS